jgi:repressor LexA
MTKVVRMLSVNLKKLRRERGLTLDDLARALETSRQTIHRYENGVISNVPPEKVAKLASALGVSPSALMGWSEEIDAEGLGLMPISVKRLPILGEIACGDPIYASEEHESYACADNALDADFCLRAHGDSMIGARILDGDIVFIRSQSSVDNGEIAAVIINDEATLKRVYYYPNEEKLILSPENPKYAPLVYIRDELNGIKILGKAVAFQSAIR